MDARHVVGRECGGGWLIVRRADWLNRARVGDPPIWFHCDWANNDHDPSVFGGIRLAASQKYSSARHCGFVRVGRLALVVKTA